MARTRSSLLAGRTARARAEGWTSYGQKRYWLERWSRETAERLADQVCGGVHQISRPKSIMCESCNALVNPAKADRGRAPDWRARLVRFARRRKGVTLEDVYRDLYGVERRAA